MNDVSPGWGGRRLWVPVGIVGAALVATLVLIALRGPTEYDPATPEGTAQGYMRALVAGDHRAAAAHLSPDLGCTPSDFRSAFVPSSLSVRLVGTEVADGRAEVDLSVSEFDGFEMPVTLVLVGGHGAWVIAETPWPLWSCETEVRG